MVGMNKRFGAVAANADVNFAVRAGSLHGLIGENGAGKSTLMSVLYGLYQADSGQVEVFGKPARIARPDDAIALGIGMVHQHFMLVDTLSALDNIMLGAEGHWHLGRAQSRVRPALDALMQQTGLHLNPVSRRPHFVARRTHGCAHTPRGGATVCGLAQLA